MKKINFLKASIAIAIMLTFGSCNKNGDKSIIQPGQPKTVTEEIMSEKGSQPR